MKKTLLLSVVASTMIMAGGDIAPVQPAVEVEEAASSWEFNGHAVGFYQTLTNPNVTPAVDAFDPNNGTMSNLGLQLRAKNKDIIAGIGAGFELTGLYTSEEISSIGFQHAFPRSTPRSLQSSFSAAVTQAYLSYEIGNTSLKVGRLFIPKSLSPFAFSETWQVIANTIEGALVVNTDLPDTTLVYAGLTRSNQGLFPPGGGGSISDFQSINANGDVVHMLTAQNKSFDGLTLTGSYYFAPDITPTDDLSIIWGSAIYNFSNYNVGVQGGGFSGAQDAKSFGAKIGGKLGMFNTTLAYSTVDNGTGQIENLATGVKTPLFTQIIFNQNFNILTSNNDTYLIKTAVKTLGGKVGAYYTYSELGVGHSAGVDDYTQFGLSYSTKFTNNISFLAAWANITFGNDEARNLIRFRARYNF